MIFGEWIKENRFIRENRVLLVVFPLVALLMGGFAYYLWRMNLNYIEESPQYISASRKKALSLQTNYAKTTMANHVEKSRRKQSFRRRRVMKRGLFSRMSRRLSPSIIRRQVRLVEIVCGKNSITSPQSMKENMDNIFHLSEQQPASYYKRPIGAIATKMLRTPPEQSYGFSFAQLHKRENYKTHEMRVTSLCCGRTSEAIRDSVKANVGKLKAMYDSALQENPNLAGKLKTRFTINGKGRITESKITYSTLHNKSFEKKIIKNIASWEFGNSPHPGEVIEVTYPFVFVENK